MRISGYLAAAAALFGVSEALVSPNNFESPEERRHLNLGGVAMRNEKRDYDFPVNIFKQKVDHFPDSDRYAPHRDDTFHQRYFFDATYYKPGGPVFLYIGGETAGPNRFSNLQSGIIKILMEATNGLGVILENRYYGKSYPVTDSSTDNLRFNTLEQAAADNPYFAQHATFPGVQGNESINSPDTPWILYGGSLAGALTAISLHEYGGDGGILWGGIAASGTTHARLAYPEWYAPIQKYAPQDCVGSINGLVDKMDQVFDSGNAENIHKMKAVFGLESLVDADFAQTIAFPLGGPFFYPTLTWQELNWDPAQGSYDFWYFCWNVTNANAPESIKQVDNELSSLTNGEAWTNLGNYANYIKRYIIPLCDGIPINNTACFSTQNETYWALEHNNGARSYLYTTCSEYGLYQVATKNGPSLVTNPLTTAYTQQWCDWAFPPGKYNSIPSSPITDHVNKYGGYNVSQLRLAHIDGDNDVWLDICYHSNLQPLRYTPSWVEAEQHPQLLINGAGHHWDSYGLGGLKQVMQEPQFIMNAHLWEIRIVQDWLSEFNAQKKK